MILDGSTAVITALQEKRRLQQSGETHDHIRPLIIFGGGLMKGVYGVGAAIAFEELGYGKVFTSVVGISSGAPTAGHFLAGSAQQGAAVLTEECCSRRFANFWRFWNQVDTAFFMDIMRHDPVKRIAADAALAHPADIYFGVADYKTAKPKLLRPETEEEFFLAMHASITMQNVSTYKTVIDGVHYADGGFTKPHAIEAALNQLEYTHVLIITNNDRDFRSISYIEKLLNRTFFRMRMNGALLIATNARREERERALEKLQIIPQPAAVVWGDGSVKSMDRNPGRLAAAVESSRVWWHGILS